MQMKKKRQQCRKFFIQHLITIESSLFATTDRHKAAIETKIVLPITQTLLTFGFCVRYGIRKLNVLDLLLPEAPTGLSAVWRRSSLKTRRTEAARTRTGRVHPPQAGSSPQEAQEARGSDIFKNNELFLIFPSFSLDFTHNPGYKIGSILARPRF